MKPQPKISVNYMKIYFVFNLLFFANMMFAFAQDSKTAEKIDQSRAASSQLFFTLKKSEPLITVNDFYDERECNVRKGMPYFFSKLQEGKELTIAFIGGSITQSEQGYRPQVAAYIQSLNPHGKYRWINAGVAGTGSDLGACRLNEQVLKHRPDLLFIEFAVNGAFADGVEGIIRQALKSNPEMGVCLIYTVTTSQLAIYTKGDIPENIKNLEKVADYYGTPSINMAIEANYLQAGGKLDWVSNKSSTNNKIQFSVDGIHPLKAGGDLYASAIARGFNKMKSVSISLSSNLPPVLSKNNWEDANMYDPGSIASFYGNWSKLKTKNEPKLGVFNNWFPVIMCTESPNDYFVFKFQGSMFGLFDIGGPEAGQLEMEIDGKKIAVQPESKNGYNYLKAIANNDVASLINRFNKFCNNRYRGQSFFVEVDDGIHEVKIKLSPQKADKGNILGDNQQGDITNNPEKYEKSSLFLGKILLRGKPIR